ARKNAFRLADPERVLRMTGAGRIRSPFKGRSGVRGLAVPLAPWYEKEKVYEIVVSSLAYKKQDTGKL
ncbi:MAG: hypothetical protein ACI4D6_05285, partial [Chordicoccus sp.]